MDNFNKLYSPRYSDFFSLVHHIGDELNDRKLRFDKADLIEMAIAESTSQKVRWVDEIGFDLQDPCSKIRFEVKSAKFCLYSKTGKPKNNTAKIKLTNTLQQSSKKTLKNTAEWLILVDTGSAVSFSMAIIEYSKVKNLYAKELNDGFECQIPRSELLFLVKPEEVTIRDLVAPSYKEEKAKLQMQMISTFLQKRGDNGEYKNSINQGIEEKATTGHPILREGNRSKNSARWFFRFWNSVGLFKKKWTNSLSERQDGLCKSLFKSFLGRFRFGSRQERSEVYQFSQRDSGMDNFKLFWREE